MFLDKCACACFTSMSHIKSISSATAQSALHNSPKIAKYFVITISDVALLCLSILQIVSQSFGRPNERLFSQLMSQSSTAQSVSTVSVQPTSQSVLFLIPQTFLPVYALVSQPASQPLCLSASNSALKRHSVLFWLRGPAVNTPPAPVCSSWSAASF